MRQIVLDTETTGLEPEQGHRIIEIGCVELLNRRLSGRTYHQYINPKREIDAGAIEVHGITNEFLADKPEFAQIADEFMEFIRGAELIIHNAPFDIGFIDQECTLLGGGHGRVRDQCGVIDTLVMARQMHPGRRNNLDALCGRYYVDNTQRDLHGALLDAEILADVYVAMTSGQTDLALGGNGDMSSETAESADARHQLPADRQALPVLMASAEELAAHDELLALIDAKSGGNCLWQRSTTEQGR
jgi:DNA polymerase-3 subunit epsilon